MNCSKICDLGISHCCGETKVTVPLEDGIYRLQINIDNAYRQEIVNVVSGEFMFNGDSYPVYRDLMLTFFQDGHLITTAQCDTFKLRLVSDPLPPDYEPPCQDGCAAIGQPDWNETDPLLHSYIKNKPQVGNTYTVIHKNDETVSRPTGFNGIVMWVGDVEPVHAKNNDLWVHNGETTVIDRDTLVWTFDTTKAGSATDRIVLPMVANGAYNFNVLYNGAVIKTITNYTDNNVVFSDGAGVKTIKIVGNYDFFVFNNAGDKLKLKSIERWGKLKVGDYTFYGCENLTLTNVLGLPNLQSSAYGGFMFCKAITTIKNINEWDVSVMTSMAFMFIDCVAFNQSLSKWDTSNVTTMEFMFRRCNVFNGDITMWDVSKVTNFTNMFNCSGFSSFTQDISSWDMSGATTINSMMTSVHSQNILGWNLKNCLNFNASFRYGTTANIVLRNLNSNALFFANTFEQYEGQRAITKIILEDLNTAADISYCILMTKTAFLELCNGDGVYRGIKDRTGTTARTIKLPNTPAGNDPDVVAAFAAKNWTVTY